MDLNVDTGSEVSLLGFSFQHLTHLVRLMSHSRFVLNLPSQFLVCLLELLVTGEEASFVIHGCSSSSLLPGVKGLE